MKNNKPFLYLISGQAIANIGDTIYTVAIISSVFSWTNSAFAASIVPVIVTGGMVISGLLTPLLSIQVSLEKILKVSQIFKTVILSCLAIYIQILSIPVNLGVVYFGVACIAFLDGCSDPVSLALLPHYVKKESLVRANSLFNTMLQVVSIGSWAVGTSLLVWFSVSELIWLDVGIFLIGSLIFIFLPKTTRKISESNSKWNELVNGWKYVWENSLIRTVVIMDMLEGVANTAWVSSIVLVFVTEIMHRSDNWWGYINATYFMGSLIGSIFVMKHSSWFDRSKSKAIVMGSFLGGLTTLFVILFNNDIFILICSVFIGIFSQIKNIPQATAIQQKVSNEKLVYIYSTSGILYTGTFSIATLIMGKLADSINVKIVFICSGIILMMVAMIGQYKKKLFS